MKVTRVETLGDIVAYKPKEIQVLGTVFDKVPNEFMEDFETVLNAAKNSYDSKVKESKDKGEKPKSAQFKKESIEEIIKPFLNKFGIEQKAVHQRVIRSDNPRIPKDDERVSVGRKSAIEDVDVDLDSIPDLFDNCNTDSMPDDAEINVDLGDSGGMVLDSDSEGLFEGDEFDFEGLLD